MSIVVHLPLPAGERIKVRGFGSGEQTRPSLALTPLDCVESPTPHRGEGK